MTDEAQGKVAVEKGLPSLLRRTRSRQGRRRTSPAFCCAVVAGVLVPAGVAFPAPTPDPPPPGEFESPPTSLAPDRQPRPPVKAPASAPPAPVEQEPTAPIEQESTTPVEQVVDPPVDRPRPVAERVTPPRDRPDGRQFATKPPRRAPPAPVVRRNEVVTFFSSTRDSRPYFLAAFSLAVFVLGTGTLLTLLARLEPARREVA